MSLDVAHELTGQLEWYWDAMLRPRLEGLTDEEYLWEPAPEGWTVRRAGGRWLPDSPGPVPEPPPFTTIAWRMCHIGSVLGARASFHFGDRAWREDAIEWPGTALGAIAFLERCWAAWKAGVDSLSSEGLEAKSEGPPGTLDAQFPIAGVIQHVNREVIHHGAEVAILRDLWRWTRPEDPLVAACLRADRSAVEALRAEDGGIVERALARNPHLMIRAAHRGDPEAVKVLAELGFDVNATMDHAALHVAAGRGDLDVVRVLIDLGADVNARDATWEATPAGWAEYFGRSEVAGYLALPAEGRSPG